MSNIKQVIVIRKDLKMRRGKEIAQGSHASMSFMTELVRGRIGRVNPVTFTDHPFGLELLTKTEIEWICDGFPKVCLQVNSEKELDDIYMRASLAGLKCHVIIDYGKTEFGGIPTKTCLAIGPDVSERIDEITSNLNLY